MVALCLLVGGCEGGPAGESQGGGDAARSGAGGMPGGGGPATGGGSAAEGAYSSGTGATTGGAPSSGTGATTGGAPSSAGAPGTGSGLLAELPNRFGFGVSSFGAVLDWPGAVQDSTDIQFDYLYWYQNPEGTSDFLAQKLRRAADLGAMPVITHYQLLERGTNAGYTGAEELDVVIQAVGDAEVMRGYYDNVQMVMETAATYGDPAIFQTEPDSTTWLRMFHTGDTNDATQGHVAVDASGHPDLSGLQDTIAGYAQALVRLRDRYAPNVFMGLCEFDNRNGNNPEHSVTFIQSLGARFDVLFTHHVMKYTSKDDGWWDAYDDVSQERFLTWIRTITSATGLKYIHWQTVIGASDYGLMPDYPTEERISDLVAAGSIANLFDLYTLDGPPHSQPWHGFTASPPPDHPAYNSLDSLVGRLERYFAEPIALR